MQFYIRLAGVDEQGATESLHLLKEKTSTVKAATTVTTDDATCEADRKSELCETAVNQSAIEVIANLLTSRPHEMAVS